MGEEEEEEKEESGAAEPRSPPPASSRPVTFTLLKANSSCLIFSLCGSVPCRRNLNFIILERGGRETGPGDGESGRRGEAAGADGRC